MIYSSRSCVLQSLFRGLIYAANMVSGYVWTVIAIGLFFAGTIMGYIVFHQPQDGPASVNQHHMRQMMSDPQIMDQWHHAMINDRHSMNRWMGKMLQDPDFQQQYMGSWMMMNDRHIMHNLRHALPQPSPQVPAVQTDNVSILVNSWKYGSPETYSPPVISILSGTSVMWTNEDVVMHTVTDLGGVFDSGFIEASGIWTYAFSVDGTYDYFCTLHPWMRGTVIVT